MTYWFNRLPLGLLVILWGMVSAPDVRAQDCTVQPDATLKDAKTTGKPFVNCTDASTPNYTLRVQNISGTKATNTKYTINWGDGTAEEDLGTFSVTKSHIYTKLGTFNLVYTVSNGTCTASKSYTVFNGSVPDVGISFQDTYDCAPATFAFTVTNTEKNEPSTRYIIDFGDGTSENFAQSDVKTFQHTYNNASIGKPQGYTITVTATNACISSGTKVERSGVYVSNGPTPDFRMEPGSEACVNSQVTLTDISDYGFNSRNPDEKEFERKWTITPATGWSYAPGYDETSEKPIINFNQTGNYIVTINLVPLEGTNPKCKGGSAEKPLKIISPPTAAFSTTLLPQPNCASAVAITNTSSGESLSYVWTITTANGNPATGVITSSGTFTSREPVFQFANPGSYNINLKVTNLCSSVNAVPKTVVIRKMPTVTLSSAKSVCGPQTIPFTTANTNYKPTYILNNATNITYAWRITGPDAGASFAAGTSAASAYPHINFAKPGIYTVWVKVISDCGESAEASQQVTIKEIPTAPEAADQIICINSAATLSSAADGTVEWFSTATNSTRLNILPSKSYTTPVQNTAGTFTYYVQTTVNGCISSRRPVTVTVTPAITNSINTTGQTICAGTAPANQLTGPVAIGGSGNFTYLWQYTTIDPGTAAAADSWQPAPASSNSPNHLPDYQAGILTQTTWFRRQATAAPCGSLASAAVKITVNPLPTAPVVAPVKAVCKNNTATLTAENVAGITYTWYNQDGHILPNASAASHIFTTPALTQEGTYTFYVTGKNDYNCTSNDRTPVTVRVLPAIENNLIQSAHPEICAGGTPSVISSQVQPTGGDGYPNFTYLWQSKSDRDLDWKTADGATNNQENYQPPAITRTTAFRRIISSGSCATPSISNEIVIKVTPSSLAPEVAPVDPVCQGENPTLQVISPDGNYEWYNARNELVGTNPAYTPTNLAAGTYTYYVLKRTTICEPTPTAVTFTVNPLISANTITPVAAACANSQPATLIGSDPAGGNGGYIYRWESRTATTAFAPVDNDNTFSAAKKDYAPGILSAPTWFRRIVKSGTCEDISAELKVDVLAPVQGNSITANGGTEFCTGSGSTVLTSVAPMTGGTGQYTYIWESSTDAFNTVSTVVAQGTGNDFAEYTPSNLTQTTWFRRQVTAGTCTTEPSNIIKITVNALPVAPTADPVAPVCVGSPATLTVRPDAGLSFTWYDANGQLLATDPAGSNRLTTAPLVRTGTYTFYVESINATNCRSARTPVTVTVQPAISGVNITQPAPICAGERPAELRSSGTPNGGNGAYSYIWESKTAGQNEFTPLMAPTDQPAYRPTALTQTTWFRRKTTSGACFEYSNTVEVLVNQPIVNNIPTTTQEICRGEVPGKIAGSPASGGDGSTYLYTWQSSTDNITFNDISNAPHLPDYQPGIIKQNTWFRRQVTSGACVNYSTAVLVKVNDPLDQNTVRLTGQAAICINTKPDLIQGSVPTGGNGTPTYLWQTSTDGATFTDAPTPNHLKDYTPGALTQPTWFRRVVSAASCQSHTSPAVKINVYQPVSNNRLLTPDQEICQGTPAPVLKGSLPEQGTGTYTYTWESSRDNQTFTTVLMGLTHRDYEPGILAKGVWYFRRRVSSGPCEEGVSAVVTITVNDPISGNFITANQLIRLGDTPAPLTGAKPKGGNGTYIYRWESSPDNRTFALVAGNTNNLSYKPGALTQTTWFRRVAVSGSCELISNLVEITVTKAIANNTITASQTVCYDTEANLLTGSTPTGGDGNYTYIWEYSTTGKSNDFSTAPSISNEVDYLPGQLKQATWFRRKVSSAGNTLISNVVKITVTDPISSNTISAAQIICAGTKPATLMGTAAITNSGKPEYLWESSTDGVHFLTATGTNNQVAYAPGTLNRTTWFRRKASVPGCATNISSPVEITVNSLPVALVPNPPSICPGSSATLTVQGNGQRYEWFESASGTTPLHTGSNFTTPVLNANQTYYVQAILQGCTGSRTPVTVTVETPKAIAGDDVLIDTGKSTQLIASGGVSYQWSPAEGLSDPKVANPLANPSTTTRYTVTVTTAEGCTAQDEVVVSIRPGVNVPNGFTPDRDGINDTWEIANIQKYPNCQVKIFNRWGTLIYSSNGYQQPWDGTYNQQDLPVATYYYSIILNKDEKPLSGSVTIIK